MTRSKHCGLRPRKTDFIEIFRTTPARTVCPNFFVLSHANGCLFSPQCDYCYLKNSFWYLQEQQAFTNIPKMLDEVRDWIEQDELESYVLNTGNLSDSLVFEPVRPVMARLVEAFREHAEARGRPHTLLLVTKGGVRHCRNLLGVAPCANVVVSFSVNSPELADKHEKGAAAVADRLEAARQLVAAGWRVRMRIDPMIVGYDYDGVVEEVRELPPERVTLGCLRAEHNLPRFADTELFEALEAPRDAKSLARYPLEKRLELYRRAIDGLNGACPVALCEETYEVWNALGLDTKGRECNCNL